MKSKSVPLFPELFRRYSRFLRPEIEEINFLHKNDRCYLETVLWQPPGVLRREVTHYIDLGFISNGAGQLCDIHAPIKANAQRFLELDAYDLLNCTDLFLERAAREIPNPHFEKNVIEMMNDGNQVTEWGKELRTFVLGPIPKEVDEADGILPLRVAENPLGAEEMVLVLFDRTPFIQEIADSCPLYFYMKSGIVESSHGIVQFHLFILMKARSLEPVGLYDVHANPQDSELMAPWRQLEHQTHWHLFLVGPGNKVFDIIEFRNRYTLSDKLDEAEEQARKFPINQYDPLLADFCQRYSLVDLLELENGHDKRIKIQGSYPRGL